MFANQVLPDAMFPKKIVGFSHAFRVEAGGRGAEPKGLYRVVGAFHCFFFKKIVAVSIIDFNTVLIGTLPFSLCARVASIQQS